METYALWESKKLKPMLMGKDLAKHPPHPRGEYQGYLVRSRFSILMILFCSVFLCLGFGHKSHYYDPKMVLSPLPNAYGKGFYPIRTEILLHRASVDVRWAGLIRLFENQRVLSRLLRTTV